MKTKLFLEGETSLPICFRNNVERQFDPVGRISKSPCSVCEAALPGNAPEGLCARCLVASILTPPPSPMREEDHTQDATLPKQRTFGDNELLE